MKLGPGASHVAWNSLDCQSDLMVRTSLVVKQYANSDTLWPIRSSDLIPCIFAGYSFCDVPALKFCVDLQGEQLVDGVWDPAPLFLLIQWQRSAESANGRSKNGVG